MSMSHREEAEEAMDLVQRIKLDLNEAIAATEGNAEAQRLLMKAFDSVVSMESFFVDYLRGMDEDVLTE
jgi:hypothetical protein